MLNIALKTEFNTHPLQNTVTTYSQRLQNNDNSFTYASQSRSIISKTLNCLSFHMHTSSFIPTLTHEHKEKSIALIQGHNQTYKTKCKESNSQHTHINSICCLLLFLYKINSIWLISNQLLMFLIY